jgi:bifunctional non-homologous end joining protein LigD
MALEKYKQKRNFKESPEPAGDPKVAAERARKIKGQKPRFFCVQKHLASHLHYDFRLEHNGVLLSWAVPKGPALDPKTKRLAMHVEDHPIEYGTFEGVIPSGYGAGIVMLWDKGTWTPEVEDVDAALKKGDLKFTLDGYKLKGSWVLVRTKGGWSSRGGGDDRSWLLIKHRDDWSGEVDIADFAPLSVKSKGDFADISRRTIRTSGDRTGRPRAERQVRCSTRSSRARWRCEAPRARRQRRARKSGRNHEGHEDHEGAWRSADKKEMKPRLSSPALGLAVQEPLAEDGPHREGKAPSVMAGNVGTPQPSEHGLRFGAEVAEFERLLVFIGIAPHRF